MRVEAAPPSASSAWSDELRVLLAPRRTFRALASSDASGWWVLLRRPLALTLAMGCGVSWLTSSSLRLSLVLDGALSLAFVPILYVAALAVLMRRDEPRPVSRARAIDILFAGNGPVFLWLFGVSLVAVWQSPSDAAVWTTKEVLAALASLLATLLWALYIDLQFFRVVLPRRPLRALVVFRALTWSLWLAWFLGPAIWAEIAGRVWR